MGQIRIRLQEYNSQLKQKVEPRTKARPDLGLSGAQILPDDRAVNLQLTNFGEEFSIFRRARSLTG